MEITQTTLDDARKAYHSLMTGAAVAEFRDQNGETVKYSAISAPRLLAYIRWLEGELGVRTATAGPMRVWM